jgi:beige protein homolog 1
MFPNLRRQRSTTSSTPPVTDSSVVLQVCLDQLSSALGKYSEFHSADISELIAQVQLLRHCFNNSPGSARPKDVFRHLHGFSALLDTLRAVSGYYHQTKRTQVEKENLFELLASILGVLSEVIRDHGNRRYFKRQVEGDGWAALEQAIASIGFGGSGSDPWSENRLFGLLLSFATDNEAFKSLFSDIQDQHTFDRGGQSERKVSRVPLASEASDTKEESQSANGSEVSDSYLLVHQEDDLEFVAFTDKMIREALDESTMLHNIDIVPTIIGFWKSLPRGRRLPDAPASLVIILALSRVSSFSTSNLLALHSTGILSIILPFTFENNTSLSACERQAAENLCSSLMCLGMSTLNDARYLLRSKSLKAKDFFLQMIQMSNRPSYIHFDLSLNGFASVELPTLGRSFPPSSAGAGYTLMAWICIDQFDNNTHTTIFGAFDSSQTCFVLVYLEKDTQNFILQTSVTSSRPSVRFKSTVFRERRWYHIAIVHRRPRSIISSKAALYVDGEFVEQVKCQYPSCPPPSNSSTDSFASFASSSSTKLNPVQVFLGTPQDLSPRLGRGRVFSRWSLASAHLFEDALSDDLIAVCYGLGPRYNGNFQDCLGSFQTYEASAALGMRNELMHPGKDEKSDILAAIREKASILLPESRILLSILPAAVLGDGSSSQNENSQLIRGLSRNASSNLFQLTRNSGTLVAINVAVSSVNDALTRVNGTAVLTGDPAVIVPHLLDDAMWRLGGCVPVGLKLIEESVSRPEIVRAVGILFQSVKSSWRNSEAMERENGYAILGALIRGKVGAGTVITPSGGANLDSAALSSIEREKLSFELLNLVLGFLGYDHENSVNSILNNPLAYRTLIVDFDMWRKTAILTQNLYYQQFVVFGVTSKYHVFNSRRLTRMRITPFDISRHVTN